MKILKVALTGGIATGKSVISEYFEKKGCYVCYSDQLAHKLMEPGNIAWEKIIEHFGESIILPDSRIDRKKLGEIIFNSEKERIFIDNLIHPLVLKEKERIVEELERTGRVKIFVSEAALTIEAGFQGFYHRIIVAHAPLEVRLKRLIERDGIDKELALKKIKSQLPNEEKLKYAHYIIDTSGDIKETLKRTSRIFKALIKDWEKLNRGYF
jgi:dephospho-CoA kinase